MRSIVLVGRFSRLVGALAIVGTVVAATPVAAEASSRQPVVETQAQPAWGCAWDCLYVTNVKTVGYPKYYAERQYVQGLGPRQLQLQSSLSTSNGYSATVGIDWKIVTAQVGYNVTQTYTLSYTDTITVPAGVCWGDQGIIIFQDKTFDIWQKQMIGDDKKIGTGRAWKVYGQEYRTIKGNGSVCPV